jgi:hypothetical protein
MIQVFACLALIALGMCVDASYQRRIRIAECDAYETGYKQGLKENQIRREITVPEFPPLQPYNEYQHTPLMAAPVAMPPTAEERLKTHGRATWRVDR